MTQIQLRRATAASWTSVNPILALGEVGIETDTYKLKVGDGTSQWSSLAYFVHAWNDITGKPSVATLAGAETLTNKTISLASNSISGTVSQFNTALSDGDFVTQDANGNVSADAFVSNTLAVNFTANNQTINLTADSPSVVTVSATGNPTGSVINLPTSGMVIGRQFSVIMTGTVSAGVQVRCQGQALVDMYNSTTGFIFIAVSASPSGSGSWLTLGQINNSGNVNGNIVTHNATQSLLNKTLISPSISSIVNTGTLTLPTSTDTLVGRSTTDNLTNKTLTNPTVNAYTEGVVTVGTVSTSHTLSITAGTVITATLTASTACTFTMPTAAAGKSFVLLLKQAASTGNGTATFTGVKWPAGTAPTITATAGRMDILSFVSDGTNWYGTAAQNFTP